MSTSEEETVGYTVIAYWEEYNYGSDRRRKSRFIENHYSTADEAISASIQAQVDDADTVRIFKGLNVEDEIGDWKDISDRIRAGCEARDKEEKAHRAREIAAENERLKAMQEKYERLQLQKLVAKYGPGGGTT
jgi:hypothetical protein